MTLHIDIYPYKWNYPLGRRWGDRFREFEGQEAIDYFGTGDWKEFPYFSGYYLQTTLHEDGECDEHDPRKEQEEDLE